MFKLNGGEQYTDANRLHYCITIWRFQAMCVSALNLFPCSYGSLLGIMLFYHSPNTFRELHLDMLILAIAVRVGVDVNVSTHPVMVWCHVQWLL